MNTITYQESRQIGDLNHLSKEETERLSYKVFLIRPEERTNKQLQAESGEQPLLQCLRYLRLERCEQQHVVCKHGDPGDTFYIILKGQVNIYVPRVDIPTSPEKKQRRQTKVNDQILQNMALVNQLVQGQSFGEQSLIKNAPRMATVICDTQCTFATLSKYDYKSVLATNQKLEQEQKRQELLAIPAFQKISERGIQMLIYTCIQRIYVFREYVYHQYDSFRADPVFFIISRGEFKVIYQSKQNTSRKKEICQLSQGELFGEIEMFRSRNRLFSVQCNSERGVVYAVKYEDLQKAMAVTNNTQVLDYLKDQTKTKFKWIKETLDTTQDIVQEVEQEVRKPQNVQLSTSFETPSKFIPKAHIRGRPISSKHTRSGKVDIVQTKENILQRLSSQKDMQQDPHQSLDAIQETIIHQNKQSLIESLIKASKPQEKPDSQYIYVKNGKKDFRTGLWPVQASIYLNNIDQKEKNPHSQLRIQKKKEQDDVNFLLKKIFASKMKKQVNLSHYKEYSFLASIQRSKTVNMYL